MAISPRKMARAWSEKAPALSHWVWERIVTSPGPLVAYPTRKERAQGIGPEIVDESVDLGSLSRHFGTRDPQDLIALPSQAGNGDTKLMVLELLPDEATQQPTPGVLFQAALAWRDRLIETGFDVALEASEPNAGFRLWVLFDFAVETQRVARFARLLTSNHIELGLNHPPAVLPNEHGQAFLRLPGMHPFGEYWSMFWVQDVDTGYWVEGSEAAEAWMALKPVSGALLREHLPPIAAESQGIEAPLSPKGRQWLTAQESEQARKMIQAVDEFKAIESALAASVPGDEIESANAGSSNLPAVENADEFNAKCDDAEADNPFDLASSNGVEPISSGTQTDVDNNAFQGEAAETNIASSASTQAAPATHDQAPLLLLAERTGLQPAVVHDRLAAWLVQQPIVLQDAILGVVPEGCGPHVAQWVLQEMANPGSGHRPSPTTNQTGSPSLPPNTHAPQQAATEAA